MITKRDIKIIQSYPTEIRLCDNKLKICQKTCKELSEKLFDNLLFKYYINSESTIYVKSLKKLCQYDLADKYVNLIPYISCKFHVKTYKKVYDEYLIIRTKYYELMDTYNKTKNKVLNITNKIIKGVADLIKRDKLISVRNECFKMETFKGTIRKISTGEKQVRKVLDLIAIDYEFYYFPAHKWKFCKNQQMLEFDFYCVLFFKEVVYHWVIEFDGIQHYDQSSYYASRENHVRDIIKQYYLAELNVHLLRLKNKKLDVIHEEINNFINIVINSKTYVAINPIIPIMEYFEDTKIHSGLKYFCNSILKNIEYPDEVVTRKKFSKNKIKLRLPDINLDKEFNESCDEVDTDSHIFVTTELKEKYFDTDSEVKMNILELFELIDKYNKKIIKDRQHINNKDIIELYFCVIYLKAQLVYVFR